MSEPGENLKSAMKKADDILGSSSALLSHPKCTVNEVEQVMEALSTVNSTLRLAIHLDRLESARKAHHGG